MPRKPSEFDAYPADLSALALFGPYRAVAKRVIDGDTFDALIDAGFNNYVYAVVRLDGIDAPEIRGGTAEEKAVGRAAKTHLETLLPVDTPIVLYTRPWPETFGRYAARVVLSGGGDVGAMMIGGGHGVAT